MVEVGPFQVDEGCSDEQFLFVDIPSKGVSIVVKLDDEGIVVDLFPLHPVDNPVASMWAEYKDFTLDWGGP